MSENLRRDRTYPRRSATAACQSHPYQDSAVILCDTDSDPAKAAADDLARMAKQRKLRNAPVTEAVVDIRVQLQAQSIDHDRLKSFGELVRTAYPTFDTQFATQIKLDAGTGRMSTKVDSVGGVFRSADRQYAIQAKSEGFSCSRLRPYTDWEALVGEAMRYWEVYKDVFVPQKVVRVATRFINRLEFPQEGFDFDDYLTISPRLPEGVPQTLSAFSNSISLPTVAPGTLCIVRSQFDPAWLANEKIAIILDLDLIKDCEIAIADDSKIWDQVNDLRPIKNLIFFGSLHEKAVEAFE